MFEVIFKVLEAKIKKRRGPEPGTTKLCIDDTFCENVTRLMSYGLKQEQIAQYFGITPATLTTYKNNYPKLFEAIERGKVIGFETSSEALMKNITKKGCIQSIKWYEQTRLGLSEKIRTENEHTHKVESLEAYLRRVKNVGSNDGRAGSEAQGAVEAKEVSEGDINSVSTGDSVNVLEILPGKPGTSETGS